MEQSIQEWTKEILWKTAIKNFKFLKFFKGCLSQNLLNPL